MTVTIKTCDAWDENIVCNNGISWVDVSTNKGYCEHHAKQAPYAIQKYLRHIWYGEPYLDDGGEGPWEVGE